MMTLGRPIPRGTRILVAMSGGVDSALTAVLLQKAGYECVGVTMRTYHPTAEDHSSGRKLQSCCSPDDAQDARSAAQAAGMPFYVLDLEREFDDAVIKPFVSEYLAGRTPNPCVLCNNHLKLGVLLDKAAMWGCDYVATGHYAIVEENAVMGRMALRRPRDRAKDQTYYLFGLTQEQLSRFVCPLGGLTKPEVRALAREHGIPVHDKPDSMEICFVPRNNYREYLRKRAGSGAIAPGDIVTEDGRVVGRHEGLACYTVGQRKGLHVSSPEPLYVIDLLAEENLVVVGPVQSLSCGGLMASRLNWVSMAEPDSPRELLAQIRYQSQAAGAVVTPLDGGRAEVQFHEAQRAVTPGQAVVLYDGDAVAAGGWIESRLPSLSKV